MLFAGIVFVLTNNVVLLAVAAIIGVISPSGNEIGPFLSIELASLSQIILNKQRTRVFAWYSLVGSFATALGALCGGALAQAFQTVGSTPLKSYRAIVIGYAAMGLVLALLFSRLSPAVEATAMTEPAAQSHLGLRRSRGVVLKLSAFFAMDAFAGGFIVQSLVAYWFHVRFGVEPALLGSIFFGANIFAGISALAAARVAARIGLINTMVFTHIPSNILLMLVPLMPNLPLAIAMLLARFSISQMDVPTRQSYTVAVVDPGERSAASGVTTIARSIGAAISPSLAGVLISVSWISVPFFLSGGLKIIYDLMLYFNFRAMKPPEELADSTPERSV
jgi:predicted MFS family arabinose efflux permease